ncbi:Co2+/Mg2+ efflux protein ApaG [Parahaliea sp. F7430]|uniref:Protein ApaG n=1 Tax=Sediminihaliea albiluteola TaxID=2758564 RepID=A0A7W2TY37_9GAMM|nr:Co2+/Mg2+ efflux protein ApaG [Sediminihaliea albiluteola]MBA6414056.1 Co2+/Mg2+ efflux protein ApaG [Sediminihaliea albiluteola]
MKPLNSELVRVQVFTTYLPSHSRPEDNQYTFAYTITIHNDSELTVQLLSRHWLITDANDKVQEVRGDGVVGEQPLIEPGTHFRYTSGATLSTPVGHMKGSYTMIVADEAQTEPSTQPAFDVAIPAFTLHTPTALH